MKVKQTLINIYMTRKQKRQQSCDAEIRQLKMKVKRLEKTNAFLKQRQAEAQKEWDKWGERLIQIHREDHAEIERLTDLVLALRE